MRGLYPVFARLVARQTPEVFELIEHRTLNDRISRSFDLSAMTERLPTTTFIADYPGSKVRIQGG